MKNWHGYTGNLLDVDLREEKIGKRPLEKELAASYMGGKGLGARILFQELPPQCEPLSSDNILVFATGPLTGTLAPSSGRFELCTKSPLTGLWLDSNCGGFFGPELKQAGYDALIIRGKAPRPVVLVIDNDQVAFQEASQIWEADTMATHRWVKRTLGPDFRVAAIGPAGERLVLFANIISEYRALGRGGAGAVMGSKQLKAIAVRGTGGVSLFDPKRFLTVCREAYNEVAIHPDTGGGRPKYGTNVILSLINEAGIHPVRNFQRGHFEGLSKVNEERIAELYVRDRACFGCPIYCSKIARVDSGSYEGSFTEGPEYENVWAFGANCENTDLGAIVHAEYLCDLYGLDGISTGNVIGFLMECREKGLLSESDMGFSLRFGDPKGMLKAIELIAERQGPARLWGEGVRKMARRIEGSEAFAMHVKGLELPAYDPRGSTGMALAYATSDRGGCHLRAWPIAEELLSTSDRMDLFSTEYKAELVKNQQDLFCMVNCAGICLFATFPLSLKQLAPFLHAATGVKDFQSSEELLKIGERVNNLVRLFNLREGLRKEDDTLPSRFFQEPIIGGPCDGRTADLSRLLSEYYLVRGWDEEGRPLPEKLMELNLSGGE